MVANHGEMDAHSFLAIYGPISVISKETFNAPIFNMIKMLKNASRRVAIFCILNMTTFQLELKGTSVVQNEGKTLQIMKPCLILMYEVYLNFNLREKWTH